MGRLYRVLRRVVCAVTHRFRVEWAEPFIDEPCIFIGNHAGAYGPLEMAAKFPLRDKQWLWCNEGIMNRKTCADYIRHDYWWPEDSKLAGFYSAVIPPVVARLLPPILKSTPTIPVYHDLRITRTFRMSVQKMEEGCHIVIFPEQADGFQSHRQEISMGWLTLCPMACARLGKPVRIYPVHVDYHHHVFRIAAPVTYDPDRSVDDQKDELAEALTLGLRGLTEKSEKETQTKNRL